VISYVPSTLREEGVNIAVVMFGVGFADLRLVSDWQRVLALDPGADIQLLEALATQIRDKLVDAEQRQGMLSTLEDSFSNAIRCSPPKGCFIEDPETEIENLAAKYL